MTHFATMPNIDLNPNDWEEVKRILRMYVPEYEVWAFGSRVTWTAKAYSDLDLAIISEQPLSLEAIANLKEAFDESTLSIKVDIVDWATTSGTFRKIIEKNRIVIQAASAASQDWSYRKLIDCTRDGVISYGIVQPGQPVQDGVPIIRVNNFSNGQLQCDDVLRVSSEIEKKYARTRLEGGEVLLTLVGTTGQSAVAPKEMAGWNIARAVAVIRPLPEIGANWINICLQTKEVQQFLNERANTTVQKTLNLGDVRELPIPIPPKEIKEQIEEIYLSLTDKIELNRQINQTLEQIAQAIFKSWFVDFEPVKAKIEARTAGSDPERAAMCAISGKNEAELDQLSAEQRYQLSATAALFPDELVESELGPIPKGWEVKEIGSLLELVYGKALPKEQRRDGFIPVYGSGGIGGFHDSALVHGPGIVVGRKGTVGSVYWVPTDFFAIDTVFYVKLLCEVPLYWAYEQLRRIDIASLGADSAVPGVNRNTVQAQHVVFPGNWLLETYWKDVEPLVTMQEAQNEHSETLATLRDALLPRLLSGELTVRPTEVEA